MGFPLSLLSEHVEKGRDKTWQKHISCSSSGKISPLLLFSAVFVSFCMGCVGFWVGSARLCVGLGWFPWFHMVSYYNNYANVKQ